LDKVEVSDRHMGFKSYTNCSIEMQNYERLARSQLRNNGANSVNLSRMGGALDNSLHDNKLSLGVDRTMVQTE